MALEEYIHAPPKSTVNRPRYRFYRSGTVVEICDEDGKLIQMPLAEWQKKNSENANKMNTSGDETIGATTDVVKGSKTLVDKNRTDERTVQANIHQCEVSGEDLTGDSRVSEGERSSSEYEDGMAARNQIDALTKEILKEAGVERKRDRTEVMPTTGYPLPYEYTLFFFSLRHLKANLLKNRAQGRYPAASYRIGRRTEFTTLHRFMCDQLRAEVSFIQRQPGKPPPALALVAANGPKGIKGLPLNTEVFSLITRARSLHHIRERQDLKITYMEDGVKKTYYPDDDPPARFPNWGRNK
ncbi:hypothetical protein AN958_03384 [Leucoagaricus sp. SymC.cos]|nr:hypothetical protein AN958_03384 [Leucoagaricus sp. SymC.cos]